MSDLNMSCQTVSDLVSALLFEQNFGISWEIRVLNFFEIV